MQDPPQVPPGLTNVEKILNLAGRDDWTDGDQLLWQELLGDVEFDANDAVAVAANVPALRLDRFIGVQLLLFRVGCLDFDPDAFVASPSSDLAIVGSVCGWFRDYISLSSAMLAWHRVAALDDESSPWLRAGVRIALMAAKEDVELLSAEDRAIHRDAMARNPFRSGDEPDLSATLPLNDVADARKWLEGGPSVDALVAFGSRAIVCAGTAKIAGESSALNWAQLSIESLERAAREPAALLRPMAYREWVIEEFGVGDGVRNPSVILQWARSLVGGASVEELRRRAEAVRRGHEVGERGEVFAEMQALHAIRNALSIVERLASLGVALPVDIVALVAIRDELP